MSKLNPLALLASPALAIGGAIAGKKSGSKKPSSVAAPMTTTGTLGASPSGPQGGY